MDSTSHSARHIIRAHFVLGTIIITTLWGCYLKEFSKDKWLHVSTSISLPYRLCFIPIKLITIPSFIQTLVSLLCQLMSHWGSSRWCWHWGSVCEYSEHNPRPQGVHLQHVGSSGLGACAARLERLVHPSRIWATPTWETHYRLWRLP